MVPFAGYSMPLSYGAVGQGAYSDFEKLYNLVGVSKVEALMTLPTYV